MTTYCAMTERTLKLFNEVVHEIKLKNCFAQESKSRITIFAYLLKRNVGSRS